MLWWRWNMNENFLNDYSHFLIIWLWHMFFFHHWDRNWVINVFRDWFLNVFDHGNRMFNRNMLLIGCIDGIFDSDWSLIGHWDFFHNCFYGARNRMWAGPFLWWMPWPWRMFNWPGLCFAWPPMWWSWTGPRLSWFILPLCFLRLMRLSV